MKKPDQEKFPWRRTMTMGLGLLRLSSEQFWTLTPKELEAAMASLSDSDASQSLTRSCMNELLQEFPDEVKNG